MRKWLDWVVLTLAIATIVAQIALVSAPNVLPIAQLIPLVVLVVCAAYFFMRPTSRQLEGTPPGTPVSTFEVPAITSPAVSPGESAYKFFAKRYGIGYGEVKVSCTILGDGSASIERQVTVEAYSQLSSLETSLLIPEPSPSGKKRGFSSPPRIEPTTDYSVSLVRVVERERKQFAEIAFSPELREDEIGGFKMTENIPPGVYAIDLSKEELEKRKTPYDYFGWNIDRPTRALHLRVYFPDGVKPKIYGSEVRYAPVMQDITTTRLQYEEQKHIMGPSLVGPEGGRYILQLDVGFPMIGLIYIVRWQPIPKRVGEAVKAANSVDGGSESIK